MPQEALFLVELTVLAEIVLQASCTEGCRQMVTEGMWHVKQLPSQVEGRFRGHSEGTREG